MTQLFAYVDYLRYNVVQVAEWRPAQQFVSEGRFLDELAQSVSRPLQRGLVWRCSHDACYSVQTAIQ